MSRLAEATPLLTRQELRKEIDKRLEKLFRERAELAQQIDAEYARLIREMYEFICRGGKRMRPYLTYLTYIGYGGDDTAAILDVAASQELFHNFLLIHDDIIDRDTVRYGGPNLTGRYAGILGKTLSVEDARHYAEGIALMAGDVNVGFAFDAILDANFSSEIKLRAAKRMTQMIFETAGGEVLDVLLPLGERNRVTTERLKKVLHYKTAAYSFSAPMQLGALLADAPDEQIEKIDKLAIPLGYAFQLVDDLLGMFGDEETTGKPVTSDLAEGKTTVLMQYAYELADPSQTAVLDRYFGNSDVDVDGHREVKAILEATGAHAKTQAMAASYTTQAGKALDWLDINPGVKQALTDVMAFTVSRKK